MTSWMSHFCGFIFGKSLDVQLSRRYTSLQLNKRKTKMAKIQHNPTEIELIDLVKTTLKNENITYIRKYRHKLKNFTDRRNHKFWAICCRDYNVDLNVIVHNLNVEAKKITPDYEVVLHLSNYSNATSIKIVYKHKK